MRRMTPVLAALALAGCGAGLGEGAEVEARTIAIRTDADVAAVAAALREADPLATFVTSPRDAAWFQELASATGQTLSGPASMAGLRMAFLGPEPVGDTTLTLRYDGGRLVIHDALYQFSETRLLDLIAFRMGEGEDTRAAIGALLEYVATDVANAAALVMAVAVPSAAAGDSVARMLAPAYYDALRCEVGAAPRSDREEIRLFYGPQARVYCADAEVRETAVGDWVRAELVLGRR